MKKSEQNIALSMIDAFVVVDVGIFFIPVWIITGGSKSKSKIKHLKAT